MSEFAAQTQLPAIDMSRAKNCIENPADASITSTRFDAANPGKADRLKDEVYRQMYLVESHRPGSEIKLAVALLRAVVYAESVSDSVAIAAWLKNVCPIGLRMLEAAQNDRAEYCSTSDAPKHTSIEDGST